MRGKISGMKLRTTIPNSRLARVVVYVNRKKWWHVPPQDPDAYSKRGKFFSATFTEAEFYGRPLDVPERVSISRPLVGDEATIAKVLGVPPQHEGMTLEEIADHDARWRKAALAKGYDSVVLMSVPGFKKLTAEGKIPRSIELNVVNLQCLC